MAALLATLLVGLIPASTRAHPAWGIVQDTRGFIFFSDTEQVWQASPEGRVSPAVPRVHTHELGLDAQDNLYGEHLWHEGDATGKWAHRMWRRTPVGALTDVMPAREGFLADYGFVRDARGTMYGVERGRQTTLRKRAPGGAAVTHSTGPFRAVERMTARHDGTLYLMDGGDLRRVSPEGVVRTLVPRLSGLNPPPADVTEPNHHMGLWTDEAGHVFVAAAGERSVLRVDDADHVTAVARSTAPWAPSGGLVDRAGRLWILEYDDHNAVRARRISPDGAERIFPAAATEPTR